MTLDLLKPTKMRHMTIFIMTNRHNGKDQDEKTQVKTCFDSYEGKHILSVKRNGLVLSTIMQKL